MRSGIPTLSTQLDARLQARRVRANSLWSNLINHSHFRDVYATFLIQTYHYIKHSCPLMVRAAEHLNNGANTDRVRSFLEMHIEEEAEHDEWVLKDLEHLGVSRLSAIISLPLPSVVGLVGSQMYLMAQFSPLALLGYMYVLEAYPLSAEVLTLIERQHGIPPACTSTLSHHSNLDMEHRDSLIHLLDDHTFQDAEEQLIIHSALITADYVCDFYAELFSLCSAKQSSMTLSNA